MAVKPAFYSLSPYGSGSSYDIKTGSPTISISSGVATLNVPQTGNIGVGCDIDYGAGPTHVYIAPNRLGFDSGGTTELKVGDKIEGGTSSATGIIRAIEISSGTWAGGDAAGYVYFSTTSGTWQDDEQINRTKPSSSSDICTANGTLQGNIGNGNTQFVVKDADGDDAGNDSGSVNYIYHEYASLSGFEAGFTDDYHIDDSDLTNAGVIAYACCYYDHDDQTADTNSVTIDWDGTTSETYYLHIFTPIGNSESINNQRHVGKETSLAYLLDMTGTGINIQEDFVRIEGLQIKVTTTGGYQNCIRSENTIANGGIHYIFNNLLWMILSGSASFAAGIWLRDHAADTRTGYVYNNIVYDIINGATSQFAGIYASNRWYGYLYNNTVHNCYVGIRGNNVGGVITVAKNNIINDCTDDFNGVIDSSSTYNIINSAIDEGALGVTHCNATVDAIEANKLHDADGDFINNGVQINSIVANTTDTQYSYVTAIVDSGELTLNDDIFDDIGDAYTIYTNMYGSVTFENEGVDDFRLGSGDSVAKDKGTDLSADGNFPLWDDIEADMRGATWDVGADEYIAEAGGLSILIAMYHYMNH